MTAPRRFAQPRERGAALILTIVIIMILTTLALTMAAFTVTEERTATTYRDSMQTRSIAEAGARVIQEMFRSPEQTLLVPAYRASATADDADPSAAPNWDYWGTNDTQIDAELNERGIWRMARSGATPEKYIGANGQLFEGPFNDNWGQVFGGTYSSTPANDRYDLKFNCTNPATNTLIADAATKCWLDTKINALLQSGGSDWNLDSGKITDISLYAPPIAAGRAYGLATVRVTAVKTNAEGNIISRETVEAVIVDVAPKPSVLADGNLDLVTNGQGALCGDGCEQIHANGTANVTGNVSGGQTPIVTATDTVVGTSNAKSDTAEVLSPYINPWDLIYKPTTTAELNKYYLISGRPLDAVWTNADPSDNPPPRRCGRKNQSKCQDYNLEYSDGAIVDGFMTGGTATGNRTTTDTPRMYKWNNTTQQWSAATCTASAVLVSCTGGPSFSITKANDVTAAAPGGDTNALPYNKSRVPRTEFRLATDSDGSTVLIDGMFQKHSAGGSDPQMTIIAVGSIGIHSNTNWRPASTNSRNMWISGRDIDIQSNCCTTSNSCTGNLALPNYSGVIAAHEQLYSQSQTAMIGLIIAENNVDNDNTLSLASMGGNALQITKGDHAYLCNMPDWPWVMPVNPAIASMKTAVN
jgi:hypothetical protein